MRFWQRISVFLVALLSVVFVFSADAAELKSGIIFPTPRAISPFVLERWTNTQGKVGADQFTNTNLMGQWSLMFFGFTHCASLCPTTMAELAQAQKLLLVEQFEPLPQVLFVTLDPQRDSLARTTEFAQAFRKDFIGLRSQNMGTLKKMTQEMSIMFEKVALAPGKDKDLNAQYTIDHSGDIIVINPQGQIAAVLTMPHEAQQIVDDYETIVETTKTAPGVLDKMRQALSH